MRVCQLGSWNPKFRSHTKKWLKPTPIDMLLGEDVQPQRQDMNHQRINRQGDLTVFVKTQCCWLVTEIFKASLFFKPQEMGEYETVLSLCVLMLMDPCQKETSVPSVDACSTICKNCGSNFWLSKFPRFWSLWMIKKKSSFPKKHIFEKKLATQKPQQPPSELRGSRHPRRQYNERPDWGIRTILGVVFIMGFRLVHVILVVARPRILQIQKIWFLFFWKFTEINDFGIQTNKSLGRIPKPTVFWGPFFCGKPPPRLVDGKCWTSIKRVNHQKAMEKSAVCGFVAAFSYWKGIIFFDHLHFWKNTFPPIQELHSPMENGMSQQPWKILSSWAIFFHILPIRLHTS